MRNFKKILLMAVILVCMESVMGFMLEPVTFQHSLERELNYMEKQGWVPDMVFLGDSRMACGISPGAVEEALGEEFCVLNAATGSQQIWGSYYYLKDLLNQYELKCVVMGVDQWAFTRQEKSVQKDLIVLDRIKNLRIKWEYVRDVFEPEEYPYLLKSYAYRGEFSNIWANLKKKLNREYLFGTIQNASKKDLNRGHTSNGTGMGEDRVGIIELSPFNDGELDPQALEYLDKVVDLCRERGVSLYLVSMPVTTPTVYATETYDNFYDFFKKYANKNKISFWDMNLLRDRKEVIPDGMMFDMEHIGSPQEVQVSRKIGELLKEDMESGNPKEAFFASVAEWKESLNGIVGCDFSTESLEGGTGRRITAKSLQADGVVPEYEFWISSDGKDGEWILLQNYSGEDSCIVPGKYFEKDVWMKVCCRKKGSRVPYEKCCKRLRSANEGD